MRSVRRSILLTVIAVFAWYAMLGVHEAGHALHAWISGGTIRAIVLDAVLFSRTEISRNPRPAFVAWGGALWGSVIPSVLWGAASLAGSRAARPAAVFAAFCLVANGIYLASALAMPVGDAEDLVRLGTPEWVVAVAGVVLLAAGGGIWTTVKRRERRP